MILETIRKLSKRRTRLQYQGRLTRREHVRHWA